MTGLSVEHVTPWLLDTSMSVAKVGLRMALILVGGYLGMRFMALGLRQLEIILTKAGESADLLPGVAQKRVTTLTGVVRRMALSLIWAIVVVEMLDQVGLDIRPILAGAGILGLAVGFGAQSLIKDLVSGFFLILENRIRVGDAVAINGTSGEVEAITLRMVVLRDFAGVVHVFPNGMVTTLSNMTMGWSAFVLDMGVAYKEDTDRAVDVMRQVAEDLRLDPTFGPNIIEPIEILGVDNFADSAVIIKARIKTQPGEQGNVGREYRRRLKKAFDAQKIEIPFPQRSLSVTAAGTPFKVEVLTGSAPTAA